MNSKTSAVPMNRGAASALKGPSGPGAAAHAASAAYSDGGLPSRTASARSCSPAACSMTVCASAQNRQSFLTAIVVATTSFAARSAGPPTSSDSRSSAHIGASSSGAGESIRNGGPAGMPSPAAACR